MEVEDVTREGGTAVVSTGSDSDAPEVESIDADIDMTSQFVVPGGRVRFMTINADGKRPRSKAEITELGSLLALRGADACLVSETHLYDANHPHLYETKLYGAGN